MRKIINVFFLFCLFCNVNGLFAQDKSVIDSLLSKMTLREKIAQLYIIDFTSTHNPKLKLEQERLVQKEKVGGVITMRDKSRPAIERLNKLNRLAPIPLLVTIDGEWGVSMRYTDMQQFPRQMQLGALPNDSLVYAMGNAIGEECKKLNIHVNYAPSVDINNNSNNPVINTRSFGEDKQKVTAFGVALMKGMKDAGVAGSAKHFPGHGDTDVDSHKGLPVLNFSKERLDSLELYPFKQLIANGVDMVMVAHLDIPILDKGRPASISKKIITDILRGEMGYKGIIITDALNMDGVAKFSGIEKANIPLEAYKAGVDIMLMPQDVANTIDIIENEFKAGKLDEQDLNERVKRVLLLKESLGLFDPSYNPIISTYGFPDKLITDKNNNLINDIARNSMVLITNKDSILPLNNLQEKNIGYLGIRGDVNGKEFATTLMNYANIDTIILRTPVTMQALEKAKAKFKNKDLIITGFHITDARPNKNFGIDDNQIKFITSWAENTSMIGVYHGSPYAIDKIDGIDKFMAFLIAHSNTPANNFISAQTIFGGAKSLGVMPVSAGWLKHGESILLNNQVRLGYDNLPDKKNKKEDFNVNGGVVKGNLAYADTIVVLSESSNLFTILPFIAKMYCDGKLTMSSTLGEYINILKPQHKNIIISDIISQRSGLPMLSQDFIYNLDNIQNLVINNRPLPEFSNANMYYLFLLAGFSFPDFDKEILESARNIFYTNEMFNTFITEDGNITTTLGDLSKFIYMLHNNGNYGGNVVMNPCEAKFINDILLYYSYNNDLIIFENKDNKTIQFRKVK